ncbi:MAG TPA: hypothetical protein VGE66_09355 [Chitinophagaceae bacterium]
MNKYLVSAVSLGALVFGASRVRARRRAPLNGKPVTPAGAVSPLVGTWKLVSGKFTAHNDHNESDEWDNSTITQYKIVTPERFMYYSMRNKSQSVQWAGMGRVAIEEDQYTEIVENTNATGLQDKELTFRFRLEGGRWYHTIDTGNGVLEEVWERVP